MAATAVFRRVTEYLRFVAGDALGVRVQAQQWKARQVVIEENVFLPRNIVVAVIAHCPLCAAVRIVTFVTFAATCQRFGIENGLYVTVCALNGCVCTVQRVIGIDVVVETHIVKTLRDVTGIAALPEMPLVIVIFAVAGDACGIHRVAERVITVTVATYEWRVLTDQLE